MNSNVLAVWRTSYLCICFFSSLRYVWIYVLNKSAFSSFSAHSGCNRRSTVRVIRIFCLVCAYTRHCVCVWPRFNWLKSIWILIFVLVLGVSNQLVVFFACLTFSLVSWEISTIFFNFFFRSVSVLSIHQNHVEPFKPVANPLRHQRQMSELLINWIILRAV